MLSTPVPAPLLRPRRCCTCKWQEAAPASIAALCGGAKICTHGPLDVFPFGQPPRLQMIPKPLPAPDDYGCSHWTTRIEQA